jgi:hypothetical protein
MRIVVSVWRRRTFPLQFTVSFVTAPALPRPISRGGMTDHEGMADIEIAGSHFRV